VHGREAESTDPDAGNLRIVPLGDVDWQVALVRGQELPRPQGWYSREYNHYEPSPVIVYSATVPGETTFAWALIPAHGAVPPTDVAITEQHTDCVSICVGGRDVTVPLTDEGEPAVTTFSNP
jgi:hypothetical protein